MAENRSEPGVPRWKRWAVTSLVLGLGAMHALELFDNGERWPFSRYAMYARFMHGPGRAVVVRGVTSDGGELDFLRPAHLQPAREMRVSVAVWRAWRRSPDALQATLRGLLQHYERRRLRGQHDSPPLVALRAYVVCWQRDARTGVQPGSLYRLLLAEVRP